MSLFFLIATSHQFSFLFLFKGVKIWSLHWRVNPSYAILEWYPWGSNVPFTIGCCSKDYSRVKSWLAVSQFIVVSTGFRWPCRYTTKQTVSHCWAKMGLYTRARTLTECCSHVVHIPQSKGSKCFLNKWQHCLFLCVCVLIFDKSRKDTFWLLT